MDLASAPTRKVNVSIGKIAKSPKLPRILKLMPSDRISWVMDYLKFRGLTIEDEPVLQLSQALRDVFKLESALANLYAMVKGEVPTLLEDDHCDQLVRDALKLD